MGRFRGANHSQGGGGPPYNNHRGGHHQGGGQYHQGNAPYFHGHQTRSQTNQNQQQQGQPKRQKGNDGQARQANHDGTNERKHGAKGPVVGGANAQEVKKELDQCSRDVGEMAKNMVGFHQRFDARTAEEVKNWMAYAGENLKEIALRLRDVHTTFEKAVFEHSLVDLRPPTPTSKDVGELPDPPADAPLEYVSMMPSSREGFDKLLPLWVDVLRTGCEPVSDPEETVAFVAEHLERLQLPKERPFWHRYLTTVFTSIVALKTQLVRKLCEEEAARQLADRIKADIRPQLEAELLVAHKNKKVAVYKIPEPGSEPIKVDLESPTKHPSFTHLAQTNQLVDQLRDEVYHQMLAEAEKNSIFFYDQHADGSHSPIKGSPLPKRAPAPAPQPSQHLQVPAVDATGKATEPTKTTRNKLSLHL
jgi:hypothetical protein